jgi:hypothetical protein
MLILSSHMHLALASDLFPSNFATKILISPLHARAPARLAHLDITALEIFAWMKSTNYEPHHYSLNPILLLFVSMKFKYPLKNCFLEQPHSVLLPRMRDQVSHPYKTRYRPKRCIVYSDSWGTSTWFLKSTPFWDVAHYSTERGRRFGHIASIFRVQN